MAKQFELAEFNNSAYSIDDLKAFLPTLGDKMKPIVTATIKRLEAQAAKTAEPKIAQAIFSKEKELFKAEYVLQERMLDNSGVYFQTLTLRQGSEIFKIILKGGQTVSESGEGTFTGTILYREKGQKFRGIETTASQWILETVLINKETGVFTTMTPSYKPLD